MNQSLIDEAERVLTSYPLKVNHIKILNGEGKKALWRISAVQGEYLLKRSHYPLEKILFSIYGQLYALDHGAKVPPILKTNGGLPYVNIDGTIYMMYKWYPEATNPNFNNKEDLKKTLIALAQFHRGCEGYIPPVPCHEKWRLGKGIIGYEKMINQLVQQYKLFKKSKTIHNPVLIEYLPTVIDRSRILVEKLNKAGFGEVLEAARSRRLMTHEDFGEPNALIVKRQGYVIDIDGLAYNLPTRELSRIIIKGIRKHGFDEHQVKQMIEWYKIGSPLTNKEEHILLLEMSLPNQFLRTFNTAVREQTITTTKYTSVIRFEEDKYRLLDQILP